MNRNGRPTLASQVTDGENVMTFRLFEVGEEIIGEVDRAPILQVFGLLERQHTNECISER